MAVAIHAHNSSCTVTASWLMVHVALHSMVHTGIWRHAAPSSSRSGCCHTCACSNLRDMRPLPCPLAPWRGNIHRRFDMLGLLRVIMRATGGSPDTLVRGRGASFSSTAVCPCVVRHHEAAWMCAERFPFDPAAWRLPTCSPGHITYSQGHRAASATIPMRARVFETRLNLHPLSHSHSQRLLVGVLQG